MKKTICIFIMLFMLISITIIQAQTVTVSGAGDAVYNGTYNYLRMTNGKNHYQHPSSLAEIYCTAGNIWCITPMGAPWVAYQQDNGLPTKYPVSFVSWTQVNGTLPAPTTTADNSLPILISQISSQIVSDNVNITWVTESEVDNLGFIMERSDNDMGNWIELTSYLYDGNMKSMGNSSRQREYRYIDSGIINGKTYQYRLSDVDIHGKISYYKPIKIKIESTKAPIKTIMENAYPNPFNPMTSINYQLNDKLNIKIYVYDLAGCLIKKLFTGQQMAGNYFVYWNGTNENGNEVPSGGYIISMKSKNVNHVQKVIFLK